MAECIASRLAQKLSNRIKLSVLGVARTLGVFALFRWLTRGRVRILCYHGGSLGDETAYNPLLFATAEFLEQRLGWLRRHGFTFVSLDDAVRMVQTDEMRPTLPLVITFDDGWYSTFKALQPVLKRQKVPATLYLCTSYFVDQWPNLDVTFAYMFWRTEKSEIWVAGLGASIDGRYPVAERNDRLAVAGKLEEWFRVSCRTRQEVVTNLGRLARNLDVPPATLDLDSRRFDFMNQEELSQLALDGWSIELHGHVHRYPTGRPAEFRAAILIGVRRRFKGRITAAAAFLLSRRRIR